MESYSSNTSDIKRNGLSSSKDEETLLEGNQVITVQTENKTNKVHIYGINDSPPIYISIISGLQVNILGLYSVLVLLCTYI